MQLGPFGNETLPPFLAASLDQVTASLGAHACPEPVLALAGTLGRLISPFAHRSEKRLKFFSQIGRAAKIGLILSLSIRRFSLAIILLQSVRIPVDDPSQTAPITPLTPSIRIEPATLDDLPRLVDLTMDLFAMEEDFEPDRERQERGLRGILEQPNRGRIFVVRTDYEILGMVNVLFTISTAMGGFVILLEDVIIHPDYRNQGYGSQLIEYVIQFARRKDFKRITLLTDKISAESQRFFQKLGFQHSHMIPMRMTFEA